jgi:predicted ester cyclase
VITAGHDAFVQNMRRGHYELGLAADPRIDCRRSLLHSGTPSETAVLTDRSEITGPGGVTLHGLKGVEMFWDIWQGAFPDNKGTISNLFGAGDRACAEVTLDSTHTGTLHLADGGQVPATGRHVRVPSTQVHTIRHDKFMTSHLYFDQFDLLSQLGLMPLHRANSHRG